MNANVFKRCTESVLDGKVFLNEGCRPQTAVLNFASNGCHNCYQFLNTG